MAEKRRREIDRERERLSRNAEAIRARCVRLSGFVKEAWHVLQPETPYVHGWHIDAICDHLEAISDGRINRLLINVPPGTMKSLLVSVFWPAWEWTTRPSLSYLTTSYSEGYVKRDSRRMRDLVGSEWYRSLWGDKVRLARTAEISFENTARGFREGKPFASLTGGRGDRVICFPAHELVETEAGPVAIGNLVDGRVKTRVWSTNVQTGETTLKTIEGWHHNPGSDLLEIGLSDGARVTCTPDHRIWTARGWVEARSLRLSDRLPVAPAFDHLNGAARNTVLVGKGALGIGGFVDRQRLVGGELGPRCGFAPSVVGWFAASVRKLGPSFAAADLLHRAAPNAVLGCESIGGHGACGNGFGIFAREFSAGTTFVLRERAVSLGIGHVRRSGAVGEVFEAAVSRVAVEVANFLARLWRSTEGQHDALVNKQDFRGAVTPSMEAGVSALAGSSATENAFFDGAGNAVLHDGIGSRFGSDTAKIADAVIPIEAGYRSPIFIRDAGHAESTYCLTVEGNHTFYAGYGNRVLVANCDDPHSTESAESEADRERTSRIFRESVPTRLNDPVRSAIVVIMQRLHEADISGQILALKLGYEHLMLPMEFEPERACATSIGFRDPRTADGELLFPERFPREVVERDKVPMGSYAVAGQFQQRPTPREGGMFKRSWFEGKFIGAAPEGTRWVRHWDLAATAKKTAARTAGVKLGRAPDGKFVVGHVVTTQAEGPDVRKLIKATAESDGRAVEISLPQDPGQAGKVQAADMVAMLAGFVARAEPETGDKAMRAEPFSAQCEAGNVLIVKGAWNEAYLDELCLFPGGSFKDQVDATSGAFGKLAKPGTPKLVIQNHGI